MCLQVAIGRRLGSQRGSRRCSGSSERFPESLWRACDTCPQTERETEEIVNFLSFAIRSAFSTAFAGRVLVHMLMLRTSLVCHFSSVVSYFVFFVFLVSSFRCEETIEGRLWMEGRQMGGYRSDRNR